MESPRDPLPADVAAEPDRGIPASPAGGAGASQVSSSPAVADLKPATRR